MCRHVNHFVAGTGRLSILGKVIALAKNKCELIGGDMHNEDANVTISNHRHVLDTKFLHTKESWVSRVHEMKKKKSRNVKLLIKI